MPPPLPRHKIILYSPFLHEEYSMAIHTELHKTAISSSSLYFSTLVINIVFSCLSLCHRHQHFLRPSTHCHLQHTISLLQSHYLYYVYLFSAFNFTLCPPSIIFTQSTTYIKRCKCHFYSPHSTAMTYSIIIINATVFATTISNTNINSTSSSSKTLSAHLPEHRQNNFIRCIRSLTLNYILSSFHFEERLCTDCG